MIGVGDIGSSPGKSLGYEPPLSPIPAVNVASVPQRSPLRYPGGKTWLVPHVRFWLGRTSSQPEQLVEPFAGGAIVALTAVMEGLVGRVVMAEIDRDVAAFWKAAIHYNEELRTRVGEFELTRDAVNRLALETPATFVDWGFRTLVLNRTRRGGILANGAALNKNGENGKGLASRWYPETIIKRLAAISEYANRIEFQETDGLQLLEERLRDAGSDTVVFADPPYTAGGKKAGSRLYNSNHVDHQRLFSLLAGSGVEFLMTYDKSPEILALIREYGLHAVQVLMKNTHHARVPELVITKRPVFDG